MPNNDGQVPNNDGQVLNDKNQYLIVINLYRIITKQVYKMIHECIIETKDGFGGNGKVLCGCLGAFKVVHLTV